MNELHKKTQRQYNKTWHQNNKDKRRKYNLATKLKLKQYIIDIKSVQGCKLCGFSHPAALDFHHRDPMGKEFAVAVAIRNGYGLNKIKTEIAKCDLICANCHRILHWNEKQNE